MMVLVEHERVAGRGYGCCGNNGARAFVYTMISPASTATPAREAIPKYIRHSRDCFQANCITINTIIRNQVSYLLFQARQLVDHLVLPASPTSSREAPAFSKSKCPISSLASFALRRPFFPRSLFVCEQQSLTYTFCIPSIEG